MAVKVESTKTQYYSITTSVISVTLDGVKITYELTAEPNLCQRLGSYFSIERPAETIRTLVKALVFACDEPTLPNHPECMQLRYSSDEEEEALMAEIKTLMSEIDPDSYFNQTLDEFRENFFIGGRVMSIQSSLD